MNDTIVAEMLTKINFLVDKFQSVGSGIKVGRIPITEDDYIDECDACTYLKVEKRYFYERRKDGDIAYTQHNRKIWYKISDIRDYMERYRIPSRHEKMAAILTGQTKYVEKRRNTESDE